MPTQLTPEVAERVRRLRDGILTQIEIAYITGVPLAIVYQLLNDPAWPKKITRIYEDGTWEILTSP